MHVWFQISGVCTEMKFQGIVWSKRKLIHPMCPGVLFKPFQYRKIMSVGTWLNRIKSVFFIKKKTDNVVKIKLFTFGERFFFTILQTLIESFQNCLLDNVYYT